MTFEESRDVQFHHDEMSLPEALAADLGVRMLSLETIVCSSVVESERIELPSVALAAALDHVRL